MAKRAVSPVDAALERVRAICLGFPAAEEKLSHGAPSFHVRGKMFLMFADDHHGDGRIAAWCKATHEAQRELVATDPARFFVPPYVGVKGWVGVRLDDADPDFIKLALIVEEGWTQVAPKNIASAAEAVRAKPRPKPAPRPTTDPKLARDALDRLEAICLALPEATSERQARHATFRVRKKVFAYFFDNYHRDGAIAACFKTSKADATALLRRDPTRFSSPPYIGARGYVAERLDVGRVDWKALAHRIVVSYRTAAPKRLALMVARDALAR